jgi:YesN/AraC family two-component response regulator
MINIPIDTPLLAAGQFIKGLNHGNVYAISKKRDAMKEHRLLLVDDDPFILEGIGEDLESNGYLVTRASSGESAVELLESNQFDLVITDLVMASTDGIQVLKKTKELNSDIQVIILTGFGDIDSAVEALRSQADDFLLKPCESQEMLFRVKNCLEKQELTRKINLYQKILPMCCVCKKIRDDTNRQPGTGEWISIERFINEQAHLDITSSYCPDCAKKTMDAFTGKQG